MFGSAQPLREGRHVYVFAVEEKPEPDGEPSKGVQSQEEELQAREQAEEIKEEDKILTDGFFFLYFVFFLDLTYIIDIKYNKIHIFSDVDPEKKGVTRPPKSEG